MKLNWLQLGFAGGLAATFLVSCGEEPPRKRANPGTGPAKPVRVARVETRPMQRALHVVGTLAAQDEATVAAQVAGQIEKTFVDLGDRVTAGQELARIDTASYEALARQAAANLARAQARAANAAQTLKRIQELQKDGSLRVVGPQEADAILEVTLTGYELTPLRYRRDQATTAREYRLTLKADVLLRKRATQEVIAKVSAEGYTTLDAVSDLPTARRLALPQAARSLALHIIKSVTEYWGE